MRKIIWLFWPLLEIPLPPQSGPNKIPRAQVIPYDALLIYTMIRQ